ncbi:hypothetical protein EBU71_14630 [bacterium]|nr:hypothetical protein [Candidatus Elulimicrobium humile]
MNIIIPIGGKGERFRERFDVPKPFIPVFEKEMLRYVLDYLVFDPEDRVFIIYYNLDEGWLRKITHSYNACLISIDKQTKGAAETIALGLEAIRAHTTHKKCVLLDCDTFYTVDVLSLYRKQDLNAVFYTCNTDVKPIFSYIQLDAQSNITRIVEKDKISDYANTGIYCFQDLDELLFYATQVVCKEFTFQGEYYTSCIIHQMIQDGLSFVGIPLDTKYVFNLGTPDQLDASTLEIIKTKYNLCSCTVTNPSCSQDKVPKPNPKPLVVPSPKVINDRYNVTSSDLELYNSLPLSSMIIY